MSDPLTRLTSSLPDSGTRLSRREMLAMLGYGVVASLTAGGAPSSAPRPHTKVDRKALHYLRLTDVARLLKGREISPVELTQVMLDRIATLNGRLHAYETVTADRALAAARDAEREIQAGRYRGALHGMPIAVKDLCYTKGAPTKGGLRLLSDFIPTFDSTVVSRLEAAGAVLLGKLNVTEGAMVGYHRDFDMPVNPWDEALWSGVSSSGSGVGTAAGLCFAALGTDTGGSIRFPSMANGIVGLKPSYGRVSCHGVLPLAPSLDHVGPMTRSVADAAIMLEAIGGFDSNDPNSLNAPMPDLLGELGRGIKGLRLGFDRAYALDGVGRGLAAAIEGAVAQLQELGAEVVDLQLPDVTKALPAWPVIVSAEAFREHRHNYPARAEDYGEYFREFLEMGRGVSEAALEDARSIRAEFSDRFRAVLSTVDAVVSPAAGEPFAVEPGLQYGSMTRWNQTRAQREQRLGIGKSVTSFTFPHNLAGTPALALPCGLSDNGLPYTMQLSGAFLGEAMLCRIGHAYEAATEWHRSHPPV